MQLVEVGRMCVQQEENQLKVRPAGRGTDTLLGISALCHLHKRRCQLIRGRQAGYGDQSLMRLYWIQGRQSSVLGQTGWGSGPERPFLVEGGSFSK